MGTPSLHMTAAASLWRARRKSRNCCSTGTSPPVSPTGGGAQCLNKHLPRLCHGHSPPCQHSGTVDINCYAQRLMPKTARPEHPATNRSLLSLTLSLSHSLTLSLSHSLTLLLTLLLFYSLTFLSLSLTLSLSLCGRDMRSPVAGSRVMTNCSFPEGTEKANIVAGTP